MEILFEQAEEKFEDEPELSDRYVELARRIGERTETPVPNKFKRMFCSSCGSFWRYGANCQVRMNPKKEATEYTCGECGEVERYAY
jgi:ribonuclease P protein subunit RPR2